MVLDWVPVASVASAFAVVAVAEAVAPAAAAAGLGSVEERAPGLEVLNVDDPAAPSFGLQPASVASSPSFLRSPLVGASAPRSLDGTVGSPRLLQGPVPLCWYWSWSGCGPQHGSVLQSVNLPWPSQTLGLALCLCRTWVERFAQDPPPMWLCQSV